MKSLAIASVLLVACGCQSVKAEDYSSEDYWRRQRRERNWADNAMHEGGRVKGSPRYKVYRPGEVHNYRAEEWREKDTRVEPEYRTQYYYNAPGRPDTMTAMGHPAVRRDVLSNVVCFPSLEAISAEYNTEEGAWKDAQRVWENTVRWKFGERFMAISNAADIVKRCNRSSGNQSIAGKAIEAVGNALGADGFRHRCEVVARPCMAPIADDAKIKGE